MAAGICAPTNACVATAGKDVKDALSGMRTTHLLPPSLQGSVQHYAFVGSAGAYKANDVEPMLVEGDERKASAGHVRTLQTFICGLTSEVDDKKCCYHLPACDRNAMRVEGDEQEASASHVQTKHTSLHECPRRASPV